MGTQQSIETQDQTELKIWTKSKNKVYSKDDSEIKSVEKTNFHTDYVVEKKFIVEIDNEPTYYLDKKPTKDDLLKMAKNLFENDESLNYNLMYEHSDSNNENKLDVYGTYKWYILSYENLLHTLEVKNVVKYIDVSHDFNYELVKKSIQTFDNELKNDFKSV